jgi:hypothetical protein
MLNSNFHVSLKGLTGTEIIGVAVSALDCETCHANAGVKCSPAEADKTICRSRFTAAVKQLSQIAAQAVRDYVVVIEGVTIERVAPVKPPTAEPTAGCGRCDMCQMDEPAHCREVANEREAELRAAWEDAQEERPKTVSEPAKPEEPVSDPWASDEG